MKPRLFIGSSSEGLDVATSIQENLDRTAECSVWSQGVFDLSDSTLAALVRELKSSDFGVFVCSADDMTMMRAETSRAVRDNVLLELGMSFGRLGSERTFFLAPDDAPNLHLPTDLLGITFERYDATRSDRLPSQATGAFCSRVRRKIEALGFVRRPVHDRLNNLAVAYACCEWIDTENPIGGMKRWDRRQQIFNKMVEECRDEPVNTVSLAEDRLTTLGDPRLDHVASSIRIFASVQARPQPSDVDVIRKIGLNSLPDGNARIVALKAVRDLSNHYKLSPVQVRKLAFWQDEQNSHDDVKRIKAELQRSLGRHAT